MCGTGACTQCLVRVNGRPNVRACTFVPSNDDHVETENAWPSPRWDLLGALDRIFPRGIDTLHGFRSPAFAAPLYHRVVRRLSGYGRIAELGGAGTRPAIGRTVETDTVVIGGGRAGRSAAAVLAEGGARALLIDRNTSMAPPTGIVQITGATAIFLPSPDPNRERPFELLARDGPIGGLRIRARSVVVAVGGYDATAWFPGSDLPGVMTAEGAEAFFVEGNRPPFREGLLFGGGFRAAQLLDRVGERIEAVAAPGAIDPTVARKASELGIALYPRTLLLEGLGRRNVRGVRLAARGSGAPFPVPVDGIVLAHRQMPNVQLFFQAGAKMEYRRSAGAYFPELTGHATTVPGLFAAGAVAGATDPDGSAQDGAQAAREVLGEPPVAPRAGPAEAPHELEGYYAELLGRSRPRGKWIACACEDVLIDEIEEAEAHGYRGIEEIKRYTSLGTGLCQGRYCLPDALLVLSILEHRPPSEVGYITQRPPVVPISLGALAALPDDPHPGGPAP